MEKINGIIVGMKVYEIVDGRCADCSLNQDCHSNESLWDFCNIVAENKIFRFSPELTDRLNGKIK